MADGNDLAQLDDAQRKHLLEVAAAVIRATVTGAGTAAGVADELAGLEVDGCFASLHAGKELRCCCGRIGRGQRLGPTLVGAAQVACRDTRFRPLEAGELDGLELEVSLLFAWTTATVPPAGRPEIVEVGTHGLLLRRGYHSGLLLPVVGRDYGWSPVEFLDATCRKAGLPPGAWRDADVELETFKALEIAGLFGKCRS